MSDDPDPVWLSAGLWQIKQMSEPLQDDSAELLKIGAIELSAVDKILSDLA